MTSQLAQAAGYLAVLIAPALLAWAARIDEPLLVFGSVMLVFPLARVALGAVDEAGPPAWSEGIAAALDRLPWVYAAVLAGAVLMLLLAIAGSEPTVGTVAGWALSLWVTMIFATCVAHELLHRKRKSDRIVGHLLAGLAGYPVLGYEHTRHQQSAPSLPSPSGSLRPGGSAPLFTRAWAQEGWLWQAIRAHRPSRAYDWPWRRQA